MYLLKPSWNKLIFTNLPLYIAYFGRALHRYRRSHGFESCLGLNIFSGFNFAIVYITVMINHIFRLFFAIQIHVD